MNPIAFSIDRAPARSGPSVIAEEMRLAGSEGRSYGLAIVAGESYRARTCSGTGGPLPHVDWPPSIATVVPVIHDAAGDAKKAAACATSSARPSRPSGTVLSQPSDDLGAVRLDRAVREHVADLQLHRADAVLRPLRREARREVGNRRAGGRRVQVAGLHHGREADEQHHARPLRDHEPGRPPCA